MDQRIDLLLPLYLQALHVAPYISIPICVRDRVQTRDIDCSVQLLLVEFDQIFNHLELGLDCLFNLGVLEQRALGRRLLLQLFVYGADNVTELGLGAFHQKIGYDQCLRAPFARHLQRKFIQLECLLVCVYIVAHVELEVVVMRKGAL